MSIKAAGGVFGRNPTFNDVTVDGDLSIAGTLSVGGNVLSGLDFEGAWDATSGAPSATPSTGQFWIVSVAGTTNLSGITNWGIGDWALYDGSAWQRIEGGADGNFNQLTSSGTTILNGTTIPASKTLVVTTDIGSTVEAYDATILKSADIGSTVQGYDADTAKYDDTTANFIGTLQNGGSNVVVDADIGSTVQGYDATILKSADIGSTVQAYDADTTKNDVSNTFTQDQIFNADVGIGVSPTYPLQILSSTTTDVSVAKFSASNYGTGGKTYVEIGTQYGDGSSRFGSVNIGGNRSALVFEPMTSSSGVYSEILRMDTSNVTITNVNLKFATAGSGIDFSATAGTGTSELFDDYEEGTWTPTVTSGGSVTTYSATYTKIGRQVTLIVANQVFSDITSGIAITVGGLPYAVSHGGVGSMFSQRRDDTVAFHPYPGGTTVTFYKNSATGSFVNLLHTDLSNATLNSIYWSVTYFTS